MTQLLIGEGDTLFKKKQIFTFPIYAPNSLMKNGMNLRVRKQQSGFVVDTGTDGNGDCNWKHQIHISLRQVRSNRYFLV